MKEKSSGNIANSEEGGGQNNAENQSKGSDRQSIGDKTKMTKDTVEKKTDTEKQQRGSVKFEQNILILKSSIKPEENAPPDFVQNSPRWQKYNKLEKRNSKVSDDFIKFSNYLIKIRNLIDRTKQEMNRDDAFNKHEYSNIKRKARSLFKKTSPQRASKTDQVQQRSPSITDLNAEQLLSVQSTPERRDGSGQYTIAHDGHIKSKNVTIQNVCDEILDPDVPGQSPLRFPSPSKKHKYTNKWTEK